MNYKNVHVHEFKILNRDGSARKNTAQEYPRNLNYGRGAEPERGQGGPRRSLGGVGY